MIRFPALSLALACLLTCLGCTAMRAQTKAPAGEQGAQTMQRKVTRTYTANYLLYLPPDYDAQPSWPLLIFLHGAGERGDDLERLKVHGPPRLVAEGRDFPFIVVSPQCPTGKWWNSETIVALLDEIVEKYHVDESRVYLTGLSMGGFGTWRVACDYPERFAAIAPICGGGDPIVARRALRQMPIWVFHGAKDPTVPLQRSQEMVDALKRVGADVKFTVYPEAQHDSWTETYNNSELYTWLLSHRKEPQARR